MHKQWHNWCGFSHYYTPLYPPSFFCFAHHSLILRLSSVSSRNRLCISGRQSVSALHWPFPNLTQEAFYRCSARLQKQYFCIPPLYVRGSKVSLQKLHREYYLWTLIWQVKNSTFFNFIFYKKRFANEIHLRTLLFGVSINSNNPFVHT